MPPVGGLNGTAGPLRVVKSVCYNQEQDAFAVATDDGVRVFNASPLVEMRHLTAEQVGSVRLAAPLHRSNLLALVAGGSRPKFAANTVMIWNDIDAEFVAEVTLPGGPILNILLNYSRLVTIQARRLHIFSLLPSLKLLRSEETRENSTGVAAMGGEGSSALLAIPSFRTGAVQIMAVELMGEHQSCAPMTIEAHQGEIAQLAVSTQGTLLATGSTKGTVIRIFDTRTRMLLNELRRGTDPATLYCLRFSPCAGYLAATSDKGTVHIFSVRDAAGDGNQRKHLFDDTKRSVAQFSLPEDAIGRCCFVSDPSAGSSGADLPSVVAVCSDGTFHRFAFFRDGRAERIGYDWLLSLASEQDFWYSGV